MIEKQLQNSPITYYVSNAKSNVWVLFVHAAFVNSNMFNKQVEYFKNKVNIITIDIIGHGKSVKIKKDDKLIKMSDWINEILIAENVDKINLLGVSLGAVIVQDFANKYPNKVASLACFGGYNINNFSKQAQKQNSKKQGAMVFKALISIKWFAKANKKISAFTPLAQQEFYEMNINFKKKSLMLLSGVGGMVNKFSLDKRNYPLLIGCGEHDFNLAIEVNRQWAKKENLELVIISNAGHCCNMDNPEDFNKQMEHFWLNNN